MLHAAKGSSISACALQALRMPRPCCLLPTAIVEAGSAECPCVEAGQSPLNGACQAKADTSRYTNLHQQLLRNSGLTVLSCDFQGPPDLAAFQL